MQVRESAEQIDFGASIFLKFSSPVHGKLDLQYGAGEGPEVKDKMSKVHRSKKKALLPLARKESLIITEMPDEVLLYDLDGNKAYCLNRPAAIVWANCDGKKTVAQVSHALERELKTPVNDAMIWLALDSLAQNGLLQGPIINVAQEPGYSRRQAMRAIALAGLALPAITWIVAPLPAQAASGLPSGACCQTNGACASGLCNQDAPSCPSPPHKSCA